MPAEDLVFKVVRSNPSEEVLARSCNLLVGRAAYDRAATMYPKDLILYCHGGRIIERSKPSPPARRTDYPTNSD